MIKTYLSVFALSICLLFGGIALAQKCDVGFSQETSSSGDQKCVCDTNQSIVYNGGDTPPAGCWPLIQCDPGSFQISATTCAACPPGSLHVGLSCRCNSDYSVTFLPGNSHGYCFSLLPTPTPTPSSSPVAAAVRGRYIFYNNSYFDGNDPAANASDDNAIATDKSALLSGLDASWVNYTSYDKGINGIMIDMVGLPVTTPLTAADFDFGIGNATVTNGTATPPVWTAAPAPTTVALRDLGGGFTRITLIWPDGVIKKEWLRITVLPTPHTGLQTADVFYFGNAVGDADAGNTWPYILVNGADIGVISNGTTNNALVDNIYDINRDGKVDSNDSAITANNGTSSRTALILFLAGENVSASPTPSSSPGSNPSPSVSPSPSPSPIVAVIGRQIFYNNSIFDGNDPGANANDDAAIATDKVAMLSTQQQDSGFINYTSYAKGINGIMVDIANLPSAAAITAADFRFSIGNATVVNGVTLSPVFARAPVPTMITQRSLGNSTTRITITWPDGAIQNEWLQITVLPSANMGLAYEDTFYFGNMIGDVNAGNTLPYITADSSDAAQITANFTSHALSTNIYDINRDSVVDAIDVNLVSGNSMNPQVSGAMIMASMSPNSSLVQFNPNSSTTPYRNNAPLVIPGLFSSDQFDQGGNAYHANDGISETGNCRQPGPFGTISPIDCTQADIEPTTDPVQYYGNDGNDIVYMQPGDWYNYTAQIKQEGPPVSYIAEIRTASLVAATVHVEVDGQDVTGPMQINPTPYLQIYESTFSKKIPSSFFPPKPTSPATYVVRFVVDSVDNGGSLNFHYLAFDVNEEPLVCPAGEEYSSGAYGCICNGGTVRNAQGFCVKDQSDPSCTNGNVLVVDPFYGKVCVSAADAAASSLPCDGGDELHDDQGRCVNRIQGPQPVDCQDGDIPMNGHCWFGYPGRNAPSAQYCTFIPQFGYMSISCKPGCTDRNSCSQMTSNVGTTYWDSIGGYPLCNNSGIWLCPQPVQMPPPPTCYLNDMLATFSGTTALINTGNDAVNLNISISTDNGSSFNTNGWELVDSPYDRKATIVSATLSNGKLFTFAPVNLPPNYGGGLQEFLIGTLSVLASDGTPGKDANGNPVVTFTATATDFLGHTTPTCSINVPMKAQVPYVNLSRDTGVTAVDQTYQGDNADAF